jgi:hypothetical protein
MDYLEFIARVTSHIPDLIGFQVIDNDFRSILEEPLRTILPRAAAELNSVTTRQNEYIFHVCLPNA